MLLVDTEKRDQFQISFTPSCLLANEQIQVQFMTLSVQKSANTIVITHYSHFVSTKTPELK